MGGQNDYHTGYNQEVWVVFFKLVIEIKQMAYLESNALCTL